MNNVFRYYQDLKELVFEASSLCQQSNTQITSMFGFDDLSEHAGFIPWTIIQHHAERYEISQISDEKIK